MTLPQLKKTLEPYCKGKKVLLDMVQDIWNSAIPTPNSYNGQWLKIIYPEHFEKFIELSNKENG